MKTKRSETPPRSGSSRTVTLVKLALLVGLLMIAQQVDSQKYPTHTSEMTFDLSGLGSRWPEPHADMVCSNDGKWTSNGTYYPRYPLRGPQKLCERRWA